ncbi:MAG: cyclophane-forming radical SAM/SPASM peptide maturase GrrM/OscB [Rhodobacter sp.]|nr:cyclophane-forming radical SAM/SPASM peptide maturase GrrM/OscB [Rhodobacter sp.]
MTLIVMQPTSGCNINCRYCYVPNRSDYSVMSMDVVRSAAKRIFADERILAKGRVGFLWHCGEPLIVGRQFYQKAFDVIEEEVKEGVSVDHSIQTNGTLINDQWCEFFAEKKIKVGLSVDGPEFLHDSSRVNWSGKGSFRKTMAGYERLRRSGIKVGALCVITEKHLDYADQLLDFFLDSKFSSVGFNVEEIENQNTRSTLLDDRLELSDDTVKRFRKFILDLFLKWQSVSDKFRIREFSDYIHVFQKRRSNKHYRRKPDELSERGIFTIQKNGDVSTFSPEFAGASASEYSNFVIGNVLRQSLSDMLASEPYYKFRDAIHMHTKSCQEACYLFGVCGGSYVSNAYFESGRFNRPESTACRLLKKEVAEMLFSELSDKAYSDQTHRYVSSEAG